MFVIIIIVALGFNVLSYIFPEKTFLAKIAVTLICAALLIQPIKSL